MIKKPDLGRGQARFISKNAFWIVLLIGVISAFIYPAAMSLRLKANFLGLLPDDMPSVHSLNKLLDKIGGTSFIIVAIESKDEESARLASEQLEQAAPGFAEVESVDNRSHIPEFAKRHMLFLSLESLRTLDSNIHDFIDYQRRKNSPFSLDLIDEKEPVISADQLKLEEKVYGIGAFSRKENDTFMRVVLIKPHFQVGDFGPSGKLFKTIEQTMATLKSGLPQPVTFGITGPYRTRYTEYITITQDLKLTTLVTLILIVLQMILGFRNIRSLVLAFVPLAIGMLWMCAFAFYAVGYLNLISGFLLGIMTGMGIDYSLHMLVELEEERKRSATTIEAIERTLKSIGLPLLTSALTTAIAFLTLTFSRFEGYRHFGLIAGVGIIFCLVVIFYGLPSLIIVGEKLRIFKWKAQPATFHLREPKAVPVLWMVAVGILLSILSLWQIPRIQFEYDFSKLQERDTSAIDLAMRIGDHFGVVLNPVAILTPNRQRADEISRQINEHVLKTKNTHIDFAASLLTQIPKYQDEKIKILADIKQVLDKYSRLIQSLDAGTRDKIKELREQLEPLPLRLEDLPVGIREQYEGKTGELSSVFVYPNHSIMDGRIAQQFVREIKSIGLPADAELAGEPVIYVDILAMLERDTPIALGLSLSVIILLLFFHFKKPMDVLWVLLPILIGFLWMVGFAGIFGVKFNYMNMAILPSVLGVGIDSGVYIFHRYKVEKKSTMSQILEKTGKAVILSSSTTMAAFGSLFLARHRGMASMGALGFIGFGCCLLASVVFIPALMEYKAMKYWRLFGHRFNTGSPRRGTRPK